MTVNQMGLWIQGGFSPLPVWATQADHRADGADVKHLYVDGGVDLGQSSWAAHSTWGLYWENGHVQQLDGWLQGKAFVDEETFGCLGYGQILGPALSSTRAEAVAIYAWAGGTRATGAPAGQQQRSQAGAKTTPGQNRQTAVGVAR